MKDNVNVNNNSKGEALKEHRKGDLGVLIVFFLILIAAIPVFMSTYKSDRHIDVMKMLFLFKEKKIVNEIQQKFHRKYDYPVWVHGKRPTTVRIYDSADEDGDVVEINGVTIPLTKAGVEMTIESKMETITIKGIKDGTGGITIGIDSYDKHTTNVVLDRVGDTVTVPIISYY